MSACIEMIAVEKATGYLKEMYEKVKTPHGTVDNVMRVHSLRPRTMEGHVVLYRSVLHSPDNTLPFWFLEIIASYTSIINQCAYSLTHHFSNVRKLLQDEPRADAIYEALASHQPEKAVSREGTRNPGLYPQADRSRGQDESRRRGGTARRRLQRRRNPGGQPGVRLFQLLEPVAQRVGRHDRRRRDRLLRGRGAGGAK